MEDERREVRDDERSKMRRKKSGRVEYLDGKESARKEGTGSVQKEGTGQAQGRCREGSRKHNSYSYSIIKSSPPVKDTQSTIIKHLFTLLVLPFIDLILNLVTSILLLV